MAFGFPIPRRAREELGPGPLICRSSAVAEDGAVASLAGAFRSVGGIHDHEALVGAAIACWCSLFEERALTVAAHAPRHATGGRPRLAMALVVHRELHARAAGVAFTCDPVPSDDGVMIVEAVPGSAADLVAGRSEPWRYERSHQRPMHTAAARASREETGPASDGQPRSDAPPAAHGRDARRWQCTTSPHDAVRAAAATAGALSAGALDDLADACEGLADAFGCEMDVEFAFTDDDPSPWIVQCRPVTAGRSKLVSLTADGGTEATVHAAGTHASGMPAGHVRMPSGDRARTPRPPDASARSFAGVACSAGTVVGRGVEIHRIGAEYGAACDVPAGSVLLLERLTVDDYALICRSAAVVTERCDAQLSHVAIACRAIGIPYVAGIARARKLLHGYALVVDGSAGTVRIAAEGQVPRAEPRCADPTGALQVESVAGPVERLLIESLPICSDARSVERWLAHMLRGVDPDRFTGIGPLSFTAEERDLIRRCVSLEPTHERILSLVRRATRAGGARPRTSEERSPTPP